MEQKIKEWVAQNVQKMRAKIKNEENPESLSQILTDYDLILSAARSVLQSVGVENTMLVPFNLAIEINKMEKDLVSRRIELMEKLLG